MKGGGFGLELEFGAPFTGRRLQALRAFLARAELDYDEGAQFTANAVDEEGGIIATGSLQDGVLKCIAVAAEHQGEDLTATVLTELVREAFRRGRRHLFLYTKPKNEALFFGLGFFTVARTGDTLLMENERGGVARFVKSLECPTREGVIGAVVVNCNPFTNGHRYLVEEAAQRCDLLHIFVLSEDRSEFSAEARLRLVRDGVRDIKNAVVHPTGDYLISSATFPTYFIKEKERAEAIRCELDIAVFAECFARELCITKRFVGTEPFCAVTRAYNEQMKLLLPRYGIELIELARMEVGGLGVSASRVRALLHEGRLEETRPLVPPTTFSYLKGMPPGTKG